jgi:16S rRNA (uracil1498-N3)-methyltransferase
MSERFYINWPLAPGPVELSGAEAHHLAKVRRFRAGDAVCLFNGDGREYAARVVHVERRRIALQVTGVASPDRELPFALEVAAPLPKGDRGQFLVEKLTELGVTRFVPLTTERSVIHPREGKLEKLQRYVIEASKQCGRNVLMQIAPVEAWASYCRRADSRSLRLLAHPGEPLIASARHESACLAVGPEGGFTDEEIALARSAGWQTIGLGPRTLRIETAALLLAARLIGSE